MEGENLASTEVPVKEYVVDTESIANPVNASKEDEEINLDREFFKVEKEALDMKDGSNVAKPAPVQDDESTITERSLNNSGRELLEAQEKMKELELELERVTGALKHSESENTKLKDEALLAKEKLDKVGKQYDELDLSHKKLQEQVLEAEKRYSLELINLQEALQAQEAKQKEFTEVKEAFDGLNIEIENSRKRMQELEKDLQSSAEEAQKFEDLHKRSGSNAESETQRALEFERLLETAKLSAKEMEDQMAPLKEEVKGLYEKVAENQKVDTALQSTISELSATREELTRSKSLVLDLEQRLASKEVLISELNATKEDLQAKVSEVEDIKLKLEDELKARELVEPGLKDQKVQVSVAQEELSKVLKEKETLEVAMADLDRNAAQKKELEARFIEAEKKNVELEQQLNLVELKGFEAEKELKEFSGKISELTSKLGEVEELTSKLGEVEEDKDLLKNQMQEYQKKVHQLESALNQSTTKIAELTQELKVAVERSAEHEDQANLSHQRSLELEDLFQTSHSKLEGADKKVNEFELLLEAEKYRIQELEEQISKLEKKCGEEEAESTGYSNKVSDLTSELEAFQARTSSLEVALQLANEKEKELTKCLNLTTDEKKKLEEMSQFSSEMLAEAENLVGILRDDLTLTQQKLESIENDLKAAGLRESEVMEKLKAAEEEVEKHVRVLEQASARNSELESLHESLTRDSEVKFREVMENFTNKDSEAKSLFEKLKSFEDQIKIYEEQVAQSSGQSATLKEELDASLIKLTSLESTNEQLRKEVMNVENKALQSSSENELLVQTNIQLKARVDELQELLNSAVSEKEVTAKEIASHTYTIRELSDQHTKALELQDEAESRIAEAEVRLGEAIKKHTKKESEANDLIEKLNMLEGQIKSYEEQAHEASEIAVSQKVEAEETLVKLKQLESFVEELQTKSAHFENESGGLAEANLKLTQELATHESKLSDLEGKLAAALTEKDTTAEQLHSSKKAIEDLTQQITSEGERFQSQISSLMEKNNLLNKTHQDTKKELQSVILLLEEQLKNEKENEKSLVLEISNLKDEISESSRMQTRAKELEEQLVKLETQLQEEVNTAVYAREAEHAQNLGDRDAINEQVLQLQRELQLALTTMNQQKEADSQKQSEREVVLNRCLEELEAKNKEALLLEKKVKELEDKLQLAEVKVKGDGSSGESKDGVEVKSRDIDGLSFTAPSKRKSKKKLEAAAQQSPSSSSTITHTVNTGASSRSTTLKFVLGVAFVSVIIGVILGKRY